MTTVNPERKERLLKTLALFGLTGIIVVAAWLSIQMVTLFPTAINQLASLADTVYRYDPQIARDIKLEQASSTVSSGQPLRLSWEHPLKTGTYSLNYECTKGIRASIISDESIFSRAECNRDYNLGNVGGAEIIFESTTDSDFVDVPYTITYFKTNSTNQNASITSQVTVSKLVTEIVAESKPASEITVNEKPLTEIATNSATPTPAAKKPTASAVVPTPSFTYTYQLPVSNPQGKVDLSVGYLGIGTLVNNQFVNTGKLIKDKPGAIQFTVKNIGTKTSADWTFSTTLPGGTTFSSDIQNPLKPNEKATLTISFPAVTETNLQKFTFSLKTKSDVNSQNDSFTWTTIVVE